MRLSLLFVLTLLAVGVSARQPTSIIFFVGDGMAPAYTSAYRYFVDDPATPEAETTIFDELLVGMARTYPDDTTLVTDSAASATALASGVKTFNGAIGVDTQRQPLTSILEQARMRGYRTGVVATSTINHATPASFIAHINSRQDYDEIADQYIDSLINGKPKVDVLFGGGRKYFVRDDRNIAQEFEAAGYQYITELEALQDVKQLPALGLFADDGMTSALNSEHPLRLAVMTEKALALLHRKPFFLLVEASQIDWCGHANDIACAMAEMHDAAATLKVLRDYVKNNPNTILVATADHGTGGLSIGADNQYDWKPQIIKNIKATAPRIAEQLLANSTAWQQEWQQLTAITLTEAEVQEFQQQLTSASANPDKAKDNLTELTLRVINMRSHTGWTTKGHTGDDVQVFSYGKRSKDFVGNLNNTDLTKKLLRYLPRK